MQLLKSPPAQKMQAGIQLGTTQQAYAAMQFQTAFEAPLPQGISLLRPRLL